MSQTVNIGKSEQPSLRGIYKEKRDQKGLALC
jgi:hypothetical protein